MIAKKSTRCQFDSNELIIDYSAVSHCASPVFGAMFADTDSTLYEDSDEIESLGRQSSTGTLTPTMENLQRLIPAMNLTVLS